MQHIKKEQRLRETRRKWSKRKSQGEKNNTKADSAGDVDQEKCTFKVVGFSCWQPQRDSGVGNGETLAHWK